MCDIVCLCHFCRKTMIIVCVWSGSLYSLLFVFSPSGCTFWGKKPWSRRKRIMWQMGTLLAAPFGIALLAAVAAPALIVGIPAYVGHRVSLRDG